MLDAAISTGPTPLFWLPDPATRARATQKVVIVNDSPEVVAQLETVLEAGQYDVVFVESNQHAYTQVEAAN